MRKNICLILALASFLSSAPAALATTTKAPTKDSKQATTKVVRNVAPKPTTETAASGANRAPAGVSDSNSALEVRGQSRNLSMMLVLKNRKSDIDFVKPRESYSNEVQNTAY